MNFDLTVIRERHAGQGAHRLALAARGDDNELIGGIAVYHIDIDNYPLGYIEIAELRRDAHDIFEASADERDLASEARRNIHYLLHAVDIGRECCNYYAVVASLAEEGLERFADLSLALGEAGTLGVGGVGHKAEDSLLPYLGESAEIHHTAVDRRCVDFEVARVDDSAALAADSESECVGYGMVDMDSLNGKTAEGYHVAGLDDVKSGGIEQSVLTQLPLNESDGELRAVDGHIENLEKIRQTADMILMSVGYDYSAYPVRVALDIGEIGKHEIDSEHILIRERKSAIDKEHILAVFKQCHILAHFIQAA